MGRGIDARPERFALDHHAARIGIMVARSGHPLAQSTWLMAIARYKALSARRRRTDASLDEKTASAIADPADDPEIVLLKKNRGELLRRSVASLSPEHGEVIDLVYYHEKSVKEIAEIVGIAEATVKTRMFYARKKLADLVVKAA